MTTPERIPFWRNVKTIGIIAQIVFAVVIVAAAAILVNNVVTALSKANLPADFSWLRHQAGIPIAERPISYQNTDPYWRALIIAFLNTLRVAIIGVVLASIIGVLVGVMRLSANWLIRTIATVYIELLRNIPLAVQIVFWYSAILLPFPPRINNPIELPGGIYISNIGIGFPFLYPTYNFMAWVPWIIGAIVVAFIAWRFRKTQLDRADTVGRVWHFPVIGFVIIAAGGYLITSLDRSVPENLQLEFNAERGRGIVQYVDDDDLPNKVGAFSAVQVAVEEGQLTAATQNLEESRQVVASTFRFPLIKESEVESAQVLFADPAAAEAAGYQIHFERFPSIGRVYVDQNGNGEFDTGEEINPATGLGYNGVGMVMQVEGFSRFLVADREGQIRTPIFRPLEVMSDEAEETTSAPAAASSRFSVFGSPPAASATEQAELKASAEVLPVGPLVLSPAHIPVTNYEGGMRFTVNYLALLLALVIYTSAFIAEIVRGGIQAVAKGQREAAEALGLSSGHTFSLVVFPQALRIVLPPIISQFLNLTKNSSLAPLAGYAELFVISSIMANQTGASIPVALMLVVSYLFISVVFAFILNKVNDRLALVER